MTNLLDANVSTSKRDVSPSSTRKVICKKRVDYEFEGRGFWNWGGWEGGRGGIDRGTFILNRWWRLDWREITTLDPLETFKNLIINLCSSYESNKVGKFHSFGKTLFLNFVFLHECEFLKSFHSFSRIKIKPLRTIYLYNSVESWNFNAPFMIPVYSGKRGWIFMFDSSFCIESVFLHFHRLYQVRKVYFPFKWRLQYFQWCMRPYVFIYIWCLCTCLDLMLSIPSSGDNFTRLADYIPSRFFFYLSASIPCLFKV